MKWRIIFAMIAIFVIVSISEPMTRIVEWVIIELNSN